MLAAPKVVRASSSRTKQSHRFCLFCLVIVIVVYSLFSNIQLTNQTQSQTETQSQETTPTNETKDNEKKKAPPSKNNVHGSGSSSSFSSLSTNGLPPPLIIGAGQGTTGTHTIHCAVCRLGIPSAHWFENCNICHRENKPRGILLDAPFYEDYDYPYGGNNKDISTPKAVAISNFHPQSTMVDLLKRFNRCVRVQWRDTLQKPCLDETTTDMLVWADQLKALIDGVLRWNPHNGTNTNDGVRNFGAVHDLVHTDVLGYVVESATKHRGQAPVILLSQRNPEHWAHRRRRSHHVVLCRLDLILARNNNNNKEPIDSGALPSTSHFDLFACIDRTIRAKTEEQRIAAAAQQQQQQSSSSLSSPTTTTTTKGENVTVNIYEVFANWKDIVTNKDPFHPKGHEWTEDDMISHISSAFEVHQNFWRTKADLHWDFFENTIAIDDIAVELQGFLSSIAHQPRVVSASENDGYNERK